MKKLIFLLTVITVVSMHAHAQKSQVGITAGTAIANYKAKVGSITVSTKSNPGFTACVFANIAAGNSLVFQPSLNWVQKGAKTDESANGYTEKAALLPAILKWQQIPYIAAMAFLQVAVQHFHLAFPEHQRQNRAVQKQVKK